MTGLLTVVPDEADIPAMVHGVEVDGVYVPPGAEQYKPGLEKVVRESAGSGHKLNFVIYDGPTEMVTNYRDIAAKVQAQTGGTIIVLGNPSDASGAISDHYSRVTLEQTEDKTDKNPTVAAQQIYNRLHEHQVPWTGVTVALIAVAVIGAVIARRLQLRGRARRAAAATAAS